MARRFDLVGAAKVVTAVDIDATGARLVAGSTDYHCFLYDFGGLKADGKPFRSWEVTEGHPVVAASWSPTGDAFLVVTSYSQVGGCGGQAWGAGCGAGEATAARWSPPRMPGPTAAIARQPPASPVPGCAHLSSPQPKVYNRDGKELGELPKGDMYIRDMKNTKGARCCFQLYPSQRRHRLCCGAPLHAPSPTNPLSRRPRDQLHGRGVAPHGPRRGADVLRGRHAAGVGPDGVQPEDGDQAAGVLRLAQAEGCGGLCLVG